MKKLVDWSPDSDYETLKMWQNGKEVEHPNFIANGKVYLVRCPKCKKENCAMAVPSGICYWCGYDANKKEGENE